MATTDVKHTKPLVTAPSQAAMAASMLATVAFILAGAIITMRVGTDANKYAHELFHAQEAVSGMRSAVANRAADAKKHGAHEEARK